MALVKCSECGKEVSDKAASCPNCGNPIAKPQPVVSNESEPEEYMCCPGCNSKDLYSNKQGFGAGKALVGGLVAGPLGLLAGGINSNKILLTCGKCKKQFKLDEAPVVLFGKTKEDFDRRIVGIMKKDGGGSTQILFACEAIKKRLNVSDNEALNYTRRLERAYKFQANRKTSSGQIVFTIVFFAIILFVFIWLLKSCN